MFSRNLPNKLPLFIHSVYNCGRLSRELCGMPGDAEIIQEQVRGLALRSTWNSIQHCFPVEISLQRNYQVRGLQLMSMVILY